MPKLEKPPTEEWNSNKTKQKAFESEEHIYDAIARETKPAIFVHYIDILIKNVRYVRRQNIIRKHNVGIEAYIVIVEDIVIIINYFQWLAKQASGCSSLCRIGSSNFADDSSCLQQTKSSPSSVISSRTNDGCSYLNRRCTKTETCGNNNEEAGSASSEYRTPRARNRSPSSKSGSPMSRSGIPSSRSGSPSSRNGSPSLSNDTSEHADDISCSRKALSFPWPEEARKGSTHRLDSGTPLAGALEYDTGYTGDIALGQNCLIEEDMKARVESIELLPGFNQDIYDTLKDSGSKQNVGNVMRTANEILLSQLSAAFDKLCMKVFDGELLGKTAVDELFRETVSDELSRKTVSDELSRKTVSDELSRKTVSDELSRKTVSDELSRQTVNDELSREIAVDELYRKTAVELSCRSSVDSQDKSDSNLTDKCTVVLPDGCSQPKLKHQCMASYEQNMRDKWLLAADKNTDFDKDNESSETESVECLIESVDDYKRDQVEDAAEEVINNKDIPNNRNAIIMYPKRVQQHMENMPYHLNVNNEKPEGIHPKSHWLSWFKHFSLNASISRKFFAEGQCLSGTKDTKCVPRKSNGFQDDTDNQIEENGEECTETRLRKIVRKAVGSRTARDRSDKYCTRLNPERCCQKEKDIHSHKTMSAFGAVKIADHTVSRFFTIKMGDQDFDNFFKLRVKFDPRRHIPWRHDIQIFHLYPSAVPSSLYIFMDFEIFRLSSFGFNKFPKDGSILVTNLAKSGFYFKSLIQQIICFGCGITFEESQAFSQSSADSFHHPQCTRHVTNKPLALWVQDLNLDALTNYFIENGSLTAYLFETPSPVAHPSRSGASNDVLKASPVSDLTKFTNDDSSGYASDALGYTESVGDTCSDDELSVDSSGGRHPFEQSSISDSNSLPAELNHISGGVGEETFDSDRSHLVLTSATRQPVWSGNTTSAGSEDRSQAPAEGAVGDTLLLSLDSAAYPHFSIEAARRRSFTVWSPQHSHTPEELAAAGFFYAGYMDCVRCFYCGLGLKFWRPGDIPAYQHAKYRPHCKFNILYKGQDYIDNVQQELRSEQQEVSNRAENQIAPPQPQESLQTTTTTSPVVGGLQEQDYLNSEAAKDALRNGWSRDQVRKAVRHIVTEYGESCLEIELLTDILTHFNTHGETSQNLPGNSAPASIDSGINSTISQLSIPPANTAPLANALTMGRGEQGRQEASQRMRDEATPAGASNAGQREARVPNPSDILRTVEREHALLEERVTCRLCRSNPVSCIYLPCGHVIACQDCADTATHCVFCKKTIIGTANIFLA